MAIVVVGGGGRGAGKTSLVCAMIRALPEFQWVAAKVTTHAHQESQSIFQELKRGQEKDSERYLVAGARSSFLLTLPLGQESDTSLYESWMDRIAERNIIFESNRVFNFIKPDLCIAVAGGAEDKASLKTAIQNADAIVVGQNALTALDAHDSSTRPVFVLENIGQLSPELADWIRDRLRYL